jgi:hypothetical protein
MKLNWILDYRGMGYSHMIIDIRVNSIAEKLLGTMTYDRQAKTFQIIWEDGSIDASSTFDNAMCVIESHINDKRKD